MIHSMSTRSMLIPAHSSLNILRLIHTIVYVIQIFTERLISINLPVIKELAVNYSHCESFQ